MKGCMIRDGAEDVGRGRPRCRVASQTTAVNPTTGNHEG